METEPKILKKKTVDRLAREWTRRSEKGPFSIRAQVTPSGKDIIEVHDGEGSSNTTLNEYLLQSGEIILENEMDSDLEQS